MTDEEFFDWLRQPENGGALYVYDMGGGRYCAVKRLIFHATMVIGEIGNLDAFDERYCYVDVQAAYDAARAWKDAQWADEPTGWHRHPTSGRRRVMGDPARETVAW